LTAVRTATEAANTSVVKATPAPRVSVTMDIRCDQTASHAKVETVQFSGTRMSNLAGHLKSKAVLSQ